jgi:hypothetical protein
MANPTPSPQAVGAGSVSTETESSGEAKLPTAAVPATPRVLDRGFKYEGSAIYTPTLLLGFAENDWEARDAFANQLSASPSPASTSAPAPEEPTN